MNNKEIQAVRRSAENVLAMRENGEAPYIEALESVEDVPKLLDEIDWQKKNVEGYRSNWHKAVHEIQQLRQERDELKQALKNSRHEREEWKERLRKGNRVVHRNKEHYRKLSERLQKDRDEWKGKAECLRQSLRTIANETSDDDTTEGLWAGEKWLCPVCKGSGKIKEREAGE